MNDNRNGQLLLIFFSKKKKKILVRKTVCLIETIASKKMVFSSSACWFRLVIVSMETAANNKSNGLTDTNRHLFRSSFYSFFSFCFTLNKHRHFQLPIHTHGHTEIHQVYLMKNRIYKFFVLIQKKNPIELQFEKRQRFCIICMFRSK